MNVEILKYPSDEDWKECLDSALETVRKNSEKTPSENWRYKIIASEHSPIRNLIFSWRWIDIPYYVSVHFVRHHIGIEHFVSSQRNDRQKDYDRRKAPQDSLVNHRCVANVQSIINISKKRLCVKSSPETIKAWKMFLKELNNYSPEIASFCVPDCIYRNGICPEFETCGYMESNAYKKVQEAYNEFFKKP